MNFDDVKNKVDVEKECTPDLLDEKSFLAIRENIEETLATMDQKGTDEYTPAVIVCSAENFNVNQVLPDAGAISFKLETRVYSGDEILPAENGIEMCAHAGKRAADDDLKPVAAFLVAEAWVSAIPEDGEFIRPRDNPNREEVVIVSGMTIGKKSTMLVYNIVRDPDNRAHLVLKTEQNPSDFQGDNLPLNQFFVSYLKKSNSSADN